MPVSFCISAPPYTVGSAGTEYDRLAVGGTAAGGDTSSNPNYAWGDGPYDAGNASFDDVGPVDGVAASASLGVRTGALLPPGAGPYHDAVQPLRSIPLGGDDGKYFSASFSPASAAEGLRYRDISRAVNAVGREIGATLAHFVGRSMGVADSGSGLSVVPTLPGEFFAQAVFGFSGAEIDALTLHALKAGLPGKAKTLRANWFPYRDGSGYLLPDCTSTNAYAINFVIAGGRPDHLDTDLQFTGAGSLPLGITFLATGGLSGTAPLRYPDFSLDGGVFRFLVRLKDKVSGEVNISGHRLNLLVDLSDPGLSPAEVTYGAQLNSQTVSTP